MTPKNKFLIDNYFGRFATINAVFFGLLFITRIFIPQSLYVLVEYVVMIFCLAIYARINFELLRPYAGIGATLLMFFILRFVLIYSVRSEVGALAGVPHEKLQIYQNLLSN